MSDREGFHPPADELAQIVILNDKMLWWYTRVIQSFPGF
jgi:hypothetical protein